MKTDRSAHRAGWLLALLLAGCQTGEPALQGTLEWDRIGLPAEASERILRVHVAEGDRVEAGQRLVELDPARAEARLARSDAEVRLARARLAEGVEGPRIEQIDAARALLAGARSALQDAEREQVRFAALRAQGTLAQRDLDRAVAARDRARAELRAADARLAELLGGTRSEQLDQAEAALAAAEAGLSEAQLALQRLSLVAPRPGRVDALPFEAGDQPPAGATVVSLLVGERPHARVFVPASLRAAAAPGARFMVAVQGVDAPFAARLRSIASEPGFTPYYALSGDDASRLVYRAELELEDERAAALPAGLTLTATAATGDGH